MIVMFDLPVKTKAQRSAATRYRNELLDFGFDRVQLSVYGMYFPNAARSQSVLNDVRAAIPPGGAVRVLRLSDAVWGSMKRYEGEREQQPEPKREQLLLFD